MPLTPLQQQCKQTLVALVALSSPKPQTLRTVFITGTRRRFFKLAAILTLTIVVY
jgi:hypothetical protein